MRTSRGTVRSHLADTDAAAAGLDGLARWLPGRVWRPGEAGYDPLLVTNWYPVLDQRPVAIVRPELGEDVAVAVRYAAEYQIPIAVRATGHGTIGPANGALLIDTSRLTGLTVDPVRRVATVEAGVLTQDLVGAAFRNGLTSVFGSGPTIGMAGFCLGGGAGWTVRAHGLGADTVRSVRVVTPDGRWRWVDANREPDLFWALRGGGGSFGVVTTLKLDLFPAAGFTGGRIYWSGDRAGDVLRAWRDMTREAPDELTSQCELLSVPWPYSGALTERDIVVVGLCLVTPTDADHDRMARRLRDLLRPLRALGPFRDAVRAISPADLDSLDAEPVPATRPWGHVNLLPDLPDAAIDTLLVHAGPGTESPLRSVTIRHLGGGRFARPREERCAVGHQNERYLMHTMALVSERSHGRCALLRTSEVAAAMRRWGTGRGIPTFLLGGDESPERVAASYGRDGFARLARIKAGVDPHNLLRINHNIPPARPRPDG